MHGFSQLSNLLRGGASYTPHSFTSTTVHPMQPKLKTVYAHHWIDGVKVTAKGRTESEALKNLLEKLKSMKNNGGSKP